MAAEPAARDGKTFPSLSPCLRNNPCARAECNPQSWRWVQLGCNSDVFHWKLNTKIILDFLLHNSLHAHCRDREDASKQGSSQEEIPLEAHFTEMTAVNAVALRWPFPHQGLFRDEKITLMLLILQNW